MNDKATAAGLVDRTDQSLVPQLLPLVLSDVPDSPGTSDSHTLELGPVQMSGLRASAQDHGSHLYGTQIAPCS